MLTVEREIDGVVYTCAKLPAEAGVALFMRASQILAPAQGLFEAMALESSNVELIRRFFDFVKNCKADEVTALTVELAKMCRGPDGAPAQARDARELLELSFLAMGVQFGDFFDVGRPLDGPLVSGDRMGSLQ